MPRNYIAPRLLVVGSLEGVPLGEITWRPVECSGFDIGDSGEKLYHHITGKRCDCEPGPHVRALWSKCTEVASIGGSGSGKTHNLIGGIFKGNPQSWVTGDPCDVSYANDQDYKFLVACENIFQADSLFRDVSRIAVKAGASSDESRLHIKFQSGAEGWFCSLTAKDSYLKHAGGSFTRVFIDGAHIIKKEVDYLRHFAGICRTPSSRLRPQIWLTALAGYDGSDWINRRFRYPHGGTEPITYGKRYECPYSKLSRVAFHSTVKDNPYFLQGDGAYLKTLNDLLKVDPALYSHRVLGDFDVVKGN